jgi:hypothetical protein
MLTGLKINLINQNRENTYEDLIVVNLNNTRTTQIKINSCRTTQPRQPNNRSKHWITLRKREDLSTYSGSYKNEVMEPSVKKSVSSHASALPRNLIRRHLCRSSDRQRWLRDMLSSIHCSTNEGMVEQKAMAQKARMGQTNRLLLNTRPIYRGTRWSCPDSIYLDPRNRPLEPLYVQLTGVHAR